MGLRSRFIVASLLFASMFVTTLAAVPGFPAHRDVSAGHADEATSHLVFKRAIARNLVLGDAIKLCLGNRFPLSTQEAVDTIHAFLGQDVFAIAPCFTTPHPSSAGVQGVLIRSGGPQNCFTSRVRGLFACAINPSPIDVDWSTLTGVVDIVVARSLENDGQSTESYIIAHELFHVFGLGDYLPGFCVERPSQIPYGGNDIDYVFHLSPSLMAYDLECDSEVPTSRDRSDFRLSYEPEAPTIHDGESTSPDVGVAVVAWDALNVHVESGFAVQRKSQADGRPASVRWTTVATKGAVPLPRLTPPRQRVMVELTDQPPGTQTYRVVSLTYAPLQSRIAASDDIVVVVQASSDASLSSLTVHGTALDLSDIPSAVYSVSVPETVSQVTVVATKNDMRASDPVIRPADADGSTAGHQITLLAAGTRTTITVAVTAEDGSSRTYTVFVARQPGTTPPDGGTPPPQPPPQPPPPPPPQCTLDVDRHPTAGGTVSFTSIGTGTVTGNQWSGPCGESVTVGVASTADDYSFNRWEGCTSISGQSCTITVGTTTSPASDRSKTVNVHFDDESGIVNPPEPPEPPEPPDPTITMHMESVSASGSASGSFTAQNFDDLTSPEAHAAQNAADSAATSAAESAFSDAVAAVTADSSRTYVSHTGPTTTLLTTGDNPPFPPYPVTFEFTVTATSTGTVTYTVEE